LKAEADIHFLQGITQLIGHGWPYSPDSVEYPGWRFYAAAVFILKTAVNRNTRHLMIRMASQMISGGDGLMCRGRSGKLLILRFTPRGLRRLGRVTTRSSRISSSTEL